VFVGVARQVWRARRKKSNGIRRVLRSADLAHVKFEV
jgi:hypothetical protein